MRHCFASLPRATLVAFCCAGFIADAQAGSDGPTTVTFTPATISAHGGTTTLYFSGGDELGGRSVGFRMRMPDGLAAPVDGSGNIIYIPASGCRSSSLVSSSGGTGTLTFMGSMTGTTGGCGFSVVLTATQAFNYDSANDGLWSVTDGSVHYYPQGTLAAVADAPTISPAFFMPTSVAFEGISRLTVTVANTDASFALSGVALAITLPAGLIVGSPSDLNSNCGGTATAVAGSSTLGFTGAALAKSGLQGDTCTFSVVVQGTSAGAKLTSALVTANEIQAKTQTATLTVDPALTATTLSSACMTTYVDAAPAQPFTVSAAVAGMDPSGSVTFADVELVGTLCGGPVALNNGTASCTTSALGAGVHEIGAVYEPDANHNASNSTLLKVTVLSASDAIFRNGHEAEVANCPVE
jgi:hypothetical protein